MNGWFERFPRAGPLLFYLALSLAMGAPFVFGGRFFVAADFLYRTPLWYDPSVPLHNFDLLDSALIFYPDDTLLHDALHRGEFSLWNPHNLAGLPIFADGQSGYFYPIRILLLLLFSTPVAHDLGLLLHLWAGGYAMYWLARRFDISPAGSLLSGVVWTLNGVAATWFSIEAVTLCLPYVPLLILTAERTFRDLRWVAGVALELALMLTVGHLQIVLNAALVVGVMLLWLWWTGPRTAVLWRPLVGFALGLALAAPLLLPTADLVSRSQRPAIKLDYLVSCQQKFLAGFLPTIWMPDVLGTPVDDFAINRVPHAGYFVYLETCAYCGVAPLLLALGGARRRGLGRFLAGLGVLAVLLPATPLYRILYLLPVFKLLNPTRLTMFWVFSISLLAGLGLDHLDRRWLSRVAAWVGALMLVTVSVMAVLSTHPDRIVPGLLHNGLVRLPSPEMSLSNDDYRKAVVAGFEAVYRPTGPDMALPLVWMAGCWVALWGSRRRAPWVLLSALDLLCFGLRFNTTVPATELYPSNATIAFLQQHVGVDRVLGIGTIKPNSLLPLDVNDIGGYGSVYARITADYWTWNEHGDLDPAHRFANQLFPVTHYRTPLVNLMGVRYLVSYPQSPIDGYPLVQAAPLPIYENPYRLPRAWVAPSYQIMPDETAQLVTLSNPAFQPRQTVLLTQAPGPESGSGGTASITTYDDDQVTVETAGGGGLLVLTDTWDPGWKVQVDGQPAPLLRADDVFRAVPVPAGAHRVWFRYAPDSLALGLRTALAALVACLLLASRPRRPQGQKA